jgi:1-acyl-sn-glycerol-3-phosphate acyltransferase
VRGAGRGGRKAPVVTITVAPGVPKAEGVEAVSTADTDPFGFDPEFRKRVVAPFAFLHDRYWRAEVAGVEHLPARGPALLVANHSGALPFDGAMIITAAQLRAGMMVRFLYDRFVDNLGPLGAFYRRVGGVAATRENAAALLAAGEKVLIFPEGVPGVAKGFSDRYRLRPFGPGFVRLARQFAAPVIPVAVVGAEEIYPMVGRVEGIGRLLGMPYVPITPFFPLLGPLGALPLPTKWFIRFGRPVLLDAGDQPEAFEAARIRRTIQTMVGRMKRRRQSVFFG